MLVIPAGRAAGAWATQLMSSVSQVGGLSSSMQSAGQTSSSSSQLRAFLLPNSYSCGIFESTHLPPLTRCTGLGRDGVSTFAPRNANGCWWVSGRELSCPPPAYPGQRHPLHIPSMCFTRFRTYPCPTTINAASAALWPKALDDQLYSTAALYLT